MELKKDKIEEFIEDFFSGPKLKKKLTQKEIKESILSQYEEKFLKSFSKH